MMNELKEVANSALPLNTRLRGLMAAFPNHPMHDFQPRNQHLQRLAPVNPGEGCKYVQERSE